jgi:hypothetical protein
MLSKTNKIIFKGDASKDNKKHLRLFDINAPYMIVAEEM